MGVYWLPGETHSLLCRRIKDDSAIHSTTSLEFFQMLTMRSLPGAVRDW
jgi:hypothetical protein